MEDKEKKNLIEDLKKELEDLEIRLKKSGTDMKVAYDEKRQKLAEILKLYARDLERSGHDRIDGLKKKATEMIDLLESDYNLSYSEYEEEPHRISEALDDLEKRSKELYDEIESNTVRVKDGLEKELKLTMDKFKTELDIQKAHFKATRDRASGEYEAWKARRLRDIEEIRSRMNVTREDAGEKVEGFRDEMLASLQHMRAAFKKLW